MNPVHFSNLRHLARSPLHYIHAATTGVDESRAMRVGSCAHAIVLGGNYHLHEGERRGKAWTEFRDAHQDGATIVTTSEYEDAARIAAAVLDNPLAVDLIEDSTNREHAVSWEYLGRACSSRLDLVGSEWIADLKTTSCADPERFTRHAIKSAIHAQLAFYNLAMGREATEPAYVIAVESAPPYPVTVLRVSGSALAQGEKLCRTWMERLLACEAEGQWPGYAQSIVTLDLPEWAEEMTLQIEGEEVAL